MPATKAKKTKAGARNGTGPRMVQLQWPVPETTRQEFRAAALTEGKTAQACIRELMDDYIAKIRLRETIRR